MNRIDVINNLMAVTFSACLAGMPVMTAPAVEPVSGFIAAMDTAETVLTTERWDLQQIQATEAWNLADGGRDVIVAVLDTGIDDSHPLLQGKVIDRVNFTTGEGIDTLRGHGTHIAGLIAAAVDGSHNSGVAFNAKLLDVKVAGNDGKTDALKVSKGIIWAADKGAQIINISIVISKPYPLLDFAVEYAWEKGCVIVAAAGNNGLTNEVYPAALPHVIAVAASDKADNLAKWSARGEWVDVAAPGVDIISTLPGSQVGTRQGTSFSTALVAGEAALLFNAAVDQDNDGRVNAEVVNMILTSGDRLDNLQAPGYRINLYNAAQALDQIADDNLN